MENGTTVGSGDGESAELAPALGVGGGGGGGVVGGDSGPAPLGAGLAGTETDLDSPVFRVSLEHSMDNNHEIYIHV